MKLSDGERLIAMMLADLMTASNVKSELDPTLIKTLLCNRDDWAISRTYHHFFSGEEQEDNVVSETTDILWMWGIVESSLRKLQGAEAEEAATWNFTQFSGFDANNDDHYGVAHTMIHHLGEFGDLKEHPLNSHSQASLPRYREMYRKFSRYVDAGQAAPLPYEALRDICNPAL